MSRRLIFIAFIKGHGPVLLLCAYLFLNFSNLELQHPGFNLIAPSLPVMSAPSPQGRWVASSVTEEDIAKPRAARYLTTEILHNSSLYIVSTNNFDGRVRKGKDGYRSTKHGGNGIGLAAIAATAEKYDGSAQASNSGTEFYVDVVLKI